MSKSSHRKNRRTPKSRRGVVAAVETSARPWPKLESEALEPRILLSATWTGTGGDDVFVGSVDADTAYGLDGNDTLQGGKGDDLLYGDAGNDLIQGDLGHDILDGGTGNDQLFGGQGNDTLIAGGGNDFLDGGAGNDSFQLNAAQNGDVITVAGGNGGQDTIDLSAYSNSQINDNGSTMTVDMGGGQSFTVNYSDIENITTSDGTYAPGNVPAGNVAPDAVDDAVSTNEGSAVTTGNVLANDTDPDGDTLSVDSFTQGSNGTVVNNGDGTFTYTPNANFSGSDSFTYTVDDGNGNQDTATVNVTVNAAPVADAGADMTVDELSQVTLDAGSSTDADGDALSYSWTQIDGPAVTLSNSNVSQPAFVAPDVAEATTLTFQVEVTDGAATSTDTVTVLVNPTAAAPPAVVEPTPPPVADDAGDTSNNATSNDAGSAPVVEDSEPVSAPVDSGAATDVSNVPATPDAATSSDAGLDSVVEDSEPVSAPDALADEVGATLGDDNAAALDPGLPAVVSGGERVSTLDTGSSGGSANNPPAASEGADQGNGNEPAVQPDASPLDNSGDDDAATNGTQWDDTDELEVLNPMADLDDAVEFGLAEDNLGDDSAADSVLSSGGAVGGDYVVEGEVVLPPVAGGLRANGSADVEFASGSSVAEAFVEVPLRTPVSTTDVAALDLEPASTEGLAPSNPDVADARAEADSDNVTHRRAPGEDTGASFAESEADRTDESSAGEADVGAPLSPVGGGFLAQLWASIRGLGGTGRRDGADGRDGRRG